MAKTSWLARFSDAHLENRTDIPDTLPSWPSQPVSVSGLSGPFPESPGDFQDKDILIELAVKPDGTPLRPVYWERQGRIIGPGQPEFFFRDSASQVGLIIRYQGDLVSIADSMLRSRRNFEQQAETREVEPIRSLVK